MKEPATPESGFFYCAFCAADKTDRLAFIKATNYIWICDQCVAMHYVVVQRHIAAIECERLRAFAP